MTDYDHIKPRTVSTLKFRKVEENMKTHTITIPDGYTAAEIEQHLASLPKRKPEPGAVAEQAYYAAQKQGLGPAEFWAFVESACRDGYVARDKVESALDRQVGFPMHAGDDYPRGFKDGRTSLAELIREALK